MDIQALKNEVEAWAAEEGQETVAIEITRQFFVAGGSPHIRLNQIEQGGVVNWKAINNNRQQIFRWLRGDSKAAMRKIKTLAPAISEALPAERRARITGDTINYLLSMFLRNVSAVVTAILLNDRDISRQAQATHKSLDAVLDSMPKRESHHPTGWRFR
ncbi:toxin YdaT family protein [Pectobacterium versatile]|uniref:toxin YdaT family protein n=1 Tax=Pectobacterium versatile TaxID=2488639 RepID=UPI0037FC0C7D